MKSVFLDEANPVEVAHGVREVLEEEGALVREHRGSRILFTNLPSPYAGAWTREGYVGIYQPLGDPDVEVRLLVRARWPFRLFWATALLNVVVALAVPFLNLSGTTWVLAAVAMALALLVTGLPYAGTFAHVRAEERHLAQRIEQALEARLGGVEARLDEEAELQRLEDELEGEVARMRVDAARRAEAPRGRFRLAPWRKAPEAPADEESLEARRAKLLARKAELEARRGKTDGADADGRDGG